MRKVLRWSLELSAAVPAVLFVAVCALWVRSHWPETSHFTVSSARQVSGVWGGPTRFPVPMTTGPLARPPYRASSPVPVPLATKAAQ
jgi:hypothetical protein